MNLPNRFNTSPSELRGIILVILGALALIYYYSWWFQEGRLTSPWFLIGFTAAFVYGTVQVLVSWVVYLGTHHRPRILCPEAEELSVDVFVTACGEPHWLIEKSLVAACAMQGSHQTWLLDDNQDSALARLAAELGAGYLTREEHRDAKAGNVNAALARTDGDIIAIFDVDHVPSPDFLQRTLGCFSDPLVGFVQVMPTFSNIREGWVARAATETSFDFYNPLSKGMDGFHSVTKMGTNSLIRRTALESIDGYQPGLAEDLATSITLHGAGWRSRYVAEPLAPGLAPPDLTAWFTQQFKWARGVFEVLLTSYPKLFRHFTWGQRLSYTVRTTNYLIGPVIFIHLSWMIATLFSGSDAVHATLQQYLLHLTPLAFCDMIIRQLALRKWRHQTIPVGPLWRAVTLVLATWPIYTLAWIMAVLRLPLSFRPTPKNAAKGLNPLWVLPQLISAALLISGVIYSLTNTAKFGSFILVYCIALGLAVPQLGLIRSLLRPVFTRNRNKAAISDEVSSNSPVVGPHSNYIKR